MFDGIKSYIEKNQQRDSSDSYSIVQNICNSSYNVFDYEVTLVSQCSSNQFFRIFNLAKVWQGQISVSVFVSKRNIPKFIEILIYMQICHADILDRILIHMVTLPLLGHEFRHRLPISKHEKDDPQYCKNYITRLSKDKNIFENYVSFDGSYPINLLRNVAIKFSTSNYILVIDIDMIPSKSLNQYFTNMIRSTKQLEKSNIAFVIPSFEIQDDFIDNIPQNKQDLLDFFRDNKESKFRPFYEAVCWKCQKWTNYKRWLYLDSSKSVLDVAYTAEWKDPWEPFYIIEKSSPEYSEIFKQYGFNRISHSCELHVAGFKFSILNNAFLTHLGFKSPKDFYAQKEEDQNMNRQKFRYFKEELKKIYLNSTRRCY